MSRFSFCNCPAGFSAAPERHAPECPGRSGAGKRGPTPVPATTPELKVTAAEELDAVLHWRGKHAQAIKERDALQRKLTSATAMHPFAEKVIRKLERFQECADDGQGADIGRHWFDLLTQLGLLNRVQRSPALWEMTQQGEDALELSRQSAKSR